MSEPFFKSEDLIPCITATRGTENYCLDFDVTSLNAKVQPLLDSIEKMRKALKFYADGNSLLEYEDVKDLVTGKVQYEDRARKVLEELGL